MKNLLLILPIVLFACTSETPTTGSLYVNQAYELYADRVVQGEFEARAISRDSIFSNYRSPANEAFPNRIQFKFALNGKDNELPVGVNHEFVVNPIDGRAETPVIIFGEQLKAEEEPISFLPANTALRIRVDARVVMQSFADKGYYIAANGETIYKPDFKGIFVAGGAEPLNWDFDNLASRPQFQLQDPDGDGIFELEVVLNEYNPDNFTASAWKVRNDLSAYPAYESGQLLVDALYRLSLDETVLLKEADGTFRTGEKWAGVWTRDLSYSVILAMALIEPEVCKTSLRRKVKNERIVQDTGTGGSWPVSSDRVVWTLAAWEIYLVTGDRAWLEEIYPIIKNSLDDDRQFLLSPDTQLARGESSFLDWRQQTYPRWMDGVDIYLSENLGTNAVHCRSYEILSEIAAELGQPTEPYTDIASELKRGINWNLWVERAGYFGQFRYGRRHFSLSEKPEALGEALCVLYDIAFDNRKAVILENTPVMPYGIPCVYPQIPGIPPYHNDGIWPFVQAYWNWAAAREHNYAALEHGLGSIYRAAALFLTNKENMVASSGDFQGTEINSDRQLWSVAGNLAMVYRVLFGMHFEPDRLVFAPVVPPSYGGKRMLTNFRYRSAILDITLEGTGHRIASVELDGEPLESAVIPGELSGAHSLYITLDGQIDGAGKINLQEGLFHPATPQASLDDRQLRWQAAEGATQYTVFGNGKPLANTTGLTFELEALDEPVELQVQAQDAQGVVSFLSEPLLVGASPRYVEFERFSRSTPTVRAAGAMEGGYVELSLEQNTTLSFEVEAPEAGEYLLQVRYANGSGPGNTFNACALRSLYLGDQFQGVWVMPQRGQDEWSNWGMSNALRVNLAAGVNQLRLQLDPFNANMNGQINRALVDRVVVY